MLSEPVRFPLAYRWYVLLAILDVLLTWVILSNGGVEVNSIAAWIIAHAGMMGASVFKFTTVAVVLVLTEWVARQDEPASRLIARSAVAINAVPVMVSVTLIMHLFAIGAQIRLAAI